MPRGTERASEQFPNIISPKGEEPTFAAGDNVRILTRSPIGHYRVPTYIRGKRARIEAVIKPPAVNNEDEGFGRCGPTTLVRQMTGCGSKSSKRGWKGAER